VFGRRAGVMFRFKRYPGRALKNMYNPMRARMHSKSKRMDSHPAGGDTGQKFHLPVMLDWKVHPFRNAKTKYWLNAYTIRGRQLHKGFTAAEIKSKTYGLGSKDKLYR
jgi:hypothetical protein